MHEKDKKEACVNYLDLIAQTASEEQKANDGKVMFPEPRGEKIVDYLEISKQWKENRGLMVNGE